HSNGPRGAARNNAGADWSRDEYRAGGAEGSVDRSAGERGDRDGRVDFRRKRKCGSRSEYLRRPGSSADCFSSGLAADNGRAGRGQRDVVHGTACGAAGEEPRARKRFPGGGAEFFGDAVGKIWILGSADV